MPIPIENIDPVDFFSCILGLNLVDLTRMSVFVIECIF